MNFEDRIRNHMTEQGEMIDITPEGPDAAIARHARRSRNRMATGMVAMLVAVAGGFGLWSLANDTEPAATQVTSIGREASERDTAAPAIEEGAEQEVIEAGAPLEVITVDSDGAPTNAYRTVVDNGVYYVLSTAPGSVDVNDPELSSFDGWPYRENTIYQFSEASGWSNVEITDRWISDFVPNDGLLYILSTGRTDGSLEPAVGVSSDQGASWDWQTLTGLEDAASVRNDGLGQSTLRLVPAAGGQYVIAQNLGNPDWQEGIDLAKAAGLPITGNRDVVHVGNEGISYNTSIAEDPKAACWEIEDRFYQMQNEIYEEFYPETYEFEEPEAVDWQEQQQQVDALIAERSGPFEAELVEAGCMNVIACRRIEQVYYSIGQDLYPLAEPAADFDWRAVERQVEELRAAQAPEIEAQLDAAGCENTVRCDRVSSTIRATFAEQQDAIAAEWEDYESMTDADRSALQIREQVLWQQIDAQVGPALQEAGCDSYYEGDGFDYQEDEITFVSWADLGVEVPASWSPSSHYFEITDGAANSISWPFNDQIVVHIEPSADGVEVTTVSNQAYYGPFPTEPGFDEPTGPLGRTWTTSDGVTWIPQGETSDPYGGSFGGPGPVAIGDVSYRINWEAMEEQYVSFEQEAVAMPEIPAGAEILFDEDAGQPYFIDPDGTTVLVPLPQMPPPMSGAPLERSIAGGAWESISLADLGVTAPDSAMVDSLLTTPIGLFITATSYADQTGSTTIAFTSDGQTWNSYEVDSSYVSPVVGTDSVLFIGAGQFNYEEGQTPPPPTTLLIKPTS